MNIDGEKLLAALRGSIESYDRTISAAVASKNYGLADDWSTMKSQLEQVVVWVANNRAGYNSEADFIHQCFQDLAPASESARIKELEEALLKLINLAQECDSWESFPQDPLDEAYDCVKATPSEAE